MFAHLLYPVAISYELLEIAYHGSESRTHILFVREIVAELLNCRLLSQHFHFRGSGCKVYFWQVRYVAFVIYELEILPICPKKFVVQYFPQDFIVKQVLLPES